MVTTLQREIRIKLNTTFIEKTKLRQTLLIISFLVFSSIEILACSCSHSWNDSFRLTAENSEFVALVKIISFDEYLKDEIIGYDGKMPYSMTVEIVKKYKGTESRNRIKVLGDNGALCRPYLSNFEVNSYYLISPNLIDNTADTEYDFFVCRTEYLKVDITTNKAYGNYSMLRKQIDIKTFENKLKWGDWDFAIVCSFGGFSILILLIVVLRKKKRSTNMYLTL